MNDTPYAPPKAPVVDTEEFSSDELVTIQTYSLPHQAHIEKNFLESEGIPAFIIGEHLSTAHIALSYASGGVKLQVPSSVAEQALELLSEFDHGEFDLDDAEEEESANDPHLSEKMSGAFSAFIKIFFALPFNVGTFAILKSFLYSTVHYSISVALLLATVVSFAVPVFFALVFDKMSAKKYSTLYLILSFVIFLGTIIVLSQFPH